MKITPEHIQDFLIERVIASTHVQSSIDNFHDAIKAEFNAEQQLSMELSKYESQPQKAKAIIEDDSKAKKLHDEWAERKHQLTEQQEIMVDWVIDKIKGGSRSRALGMLNLIKPDHDMHSPIIIAEEVVPELVKRWTKKKQLELKQEAST